MCSRLPESYSQSYVRLTPAYDIGVYLTENADNNAKLHIVDHPWEPPQSFQWPSSTHKKVGKQGKVREETRKLAREHLRQFNWVAFSESAGGMLCRFCVLFGKRGGVVGAASCSQSAGKFVSTPCKKYNKLTGEKNGVLNGHSKMEYHKQAVEAAMAFRMAQLRPELAIASRVDVQRLTELGLIRERLGPIVKTVVLCGKQNIAFRGNEDSGRVDLKEPDRNEGNFRAILRYRAECDQGLQTHLRECSGNAKYTSSSIQNELIDLVGKLVQESIVSEINSSKAGPCFTVLVDETTDVSTIEQLSLCVRYVTDDAGVHESFLTFGDVHHEAFSLDFSLLEAGEVLEPKITGKVIAKVIKRTVQELGLKMEDCVGQGYDGAAVMGSNTVGAAAVIAREYPMAVHLHCCSHSLNLALVSASKLREVANMYGKVKEVVTFINASAKRNALFKAAVEYKCPAARRYRLVKFCETRWVERHESLTTFLELLDAIMLTLEHISKWRDTNSSAKASILLTAIKNGDFLLVLQATAKVMSYTRPLAVKLQKESQDLSGAVPIVDSVVEALIDLREQAEPVFSQLFAGVQEKVAEMNAAPVSAPRQKKNDMADPEKHHRTTTFIPLLEETTGELKRRFQKQTRTAMKIGRLLPGHPDFDSLGQSVVQELAAQYSGQLEKTGLSASGMDAAAEFDVYRAAWLLRPPKERPMTFTEALKTCDMQAFPAVWRLLRIGACQPVTTATAERSFSVLRRLKTWLRSRTGEDRLTGLALMNIHPNHVPSCEAILDRFMRQKNRRVGQLLPAASRSGRV